MRRFPVIFMIRHGDIRLLSEGMKRDAFDFVEKPFDAEKLMDRVDDALAASRHMNASKMIHSRLAVLSAREKEVLGLILDGYMNKVIGEKLGISRRTVEAHRANIFHKINVKNAMELARFLR
jgi:two-component system response regulator DctR